MVEAGEAQVELSMLLVVVEEVEVQVVEAVALRVRST